MAFDGIVTKSVVYELNSCLLGGKINKIFQPSKNELLINIYANGKNQILNISINSNNYRINLTSHTKPNPLNAPNFCMFLRKHLIGFKIHSISTYDLERIVTIDLEGYNELNDLVHKKLIIELMGKHSNIILVNENNIILDSIRHLDISSGSLRDIMPARIYELPKNDKIDFYSLKGYQDFKKVIKSSKDFSIKKILYTSFIGFSKTFVESIPFEMNIENLENIYNYIKNILDNISKLICKPTNDGYSVIINEEKDSPIAINEFLDNYYFEKETRNAFISYRNQILKNVLTLLKKYTKRLDNINNKLEECKKMNSYQLYGELITANLYRLNSSDNRNEITLENYYDNNNTITIPLDESICISANAKKYFKKYNKLKNTLEIVSKQKKITKAELDYIESIIYSLESTKSIEENDEIKDENLENLSLGKNLKNSASTKKKSKTYSTQLSSVVIDGYNVFVGKSNKQNDYLTLRIAKKDDIWFHTKDIHGSHVVLQTNHSTPSTTTLIKCASLAAYYSKAQNSSNVPVDYTFIKNVKKPSGSKPGMVIYTDYETINVNPTKY